MLIIVNTQTFFRGAPGCVASRFRAGAGSSYIYLYIYLYYITYMFFTLAATSLKSVRET